MGDSAGHPRRVAAWPGAMDKGCAGRGRRRSAVDRDGSLQNLPRLNSHGCHMRGSLLNRARDGRVRTCMRVVMPHAAHGQLGGRDGCQLGGLACGGSEGLIRSEVVGQYEAGWVGLQARTLCVQSACGRHRPGAVGIGAQAAANNRSLAQ